MLINMRSVAFSVSLLLTSSAADSYRYVNNLKLRRVIDKLLQTLEFLSNFNLPTISSQTCLANTKFMGWWGGGGESNNSDYKFTCSHNSPWQWVQLELAFCLVDCLLCMQLHIFSTNPPAAGSFNLYPSPYPLSPRAAPGHGLLNVCASMLNKFAYFSSSLVWQKLNFLCKNSTLMTKSERITMRKKEKTKRK